MIDRYTKVLLTIIAINMSIMVGWGAVKVFVPEVVAQQTVPVYVKGGETLDVNIDRVGGKYLGYGRPIPVKVK